MRNAAIPALTRGWFSAPARRRLVEAARTRPPAVSAVTRTRVFSAGGRAFFRGIRLGASARPRILADAGVAGRSLGTNLASISRAGAGRVWSTGCCLGIGDAGLDGIGTGALGAGADPNFLVDEAGAAWGIGTRVFVLASRRLGAIPGPGAARRRSSETC